MTDETKITTTDQLPLDEWFDKTDEVLSRATPLPWMWGQHNEETVEKLAEYAAFCMGKRDSTEAHMAFVLDPDLGADAYLQTAMTGNGPRSAANAQLIVGVVNAYPILRDRIRELEGEVEQLKVANERVTRDPLGMRCADALADEVAALVRRGVIDQRSSAADALLDYRNPPSSERADRLATLESENERLRNRTEDHPEHRWQTLVGGRRCIVCGRQEACRAGEEATAFDDSPWSSTRWLRILDPNGRLWMESSDEEEVRKESERTGWPMERLWHNDIKVWKREK